MSSLFSRAAAILLAAALLAPAALCDGGVPDHPSKLTFEPLVYHPPKPLEHRTVLSNGMVVYIQEDKLLPTLDVSALVRTGSIYEPAEKAGIAAMTGEVMRTGGTAVLSGDELDERIAYLGGSIRASIGTFSGGASLSVLMKDAGEGLALFADVLMRPAFEEEKIVLYRDEALASLKTKNDNPRSLLGREFDKLLYGSHPLVREETKATIESITRQDLLDFHARFFAPSNVILAVAGEFDRAEMLELLERTFAEWKPREIEIPKIPPVEVKNRPGLFMIQKEISQGYLNIGHFGIKENDPDWFAVDIMNFILGGGSFTSRITTKVRSDEGLAYNTGCTFASRLLFPGTFYGYVQTKSSTVPYAISLILDEFARIRKELVTDEEMDTAKSYFLDSFSNRFSGAFATMEEFARLEYDGYPFDWYETFRDKYEAVTKEEVLRVAQERIQPDQMSILIVGDLESCRAGDGKHECKLEDFGPITEIVLKDPLTGE